jgi:hypothetical protein
MMDGDGDNPLCDVENDDCKFRHQLESPYPLIDDGTFRG